MQAKFSVHNGLGNVLFIDMSYEEMVCLGRILKQEAFKGSDIADEMYEELKDAIFDNRGNLLADEVRSRLYDVQSTI